MFRFYFYLRRLLSYYPTVTKQYFEKAIFYVIHKGENVTQAEGV